MMIHPCNQATGWKRQSEVFKVSLSYNNDKACVDVETCWCDGISRSCRRGTALKEISDQRKERTHAKDPRTKHETVPVPFPARDAQGLERKAQEHTNDGLLGRPGNFKQTENMLLNPQRKPGAW